jgi:hypothetical protein
MILLILKNLILQCWSYRNNIVDIKLVRNYFKNFIEELNKKELRKLYYKLNAVIMLL